MNKLRELFKSNKNILLFSISLYLILILVLKVGLNLHDFNLEFGLLPALSLLLGPLAVLGFIIAEFAYFLLFDLDSISTIIPLVLLGTINLMIWKLWYSMMNRYGNEIPNLGRTYNIVKLFYIFIINYILTRFIFMGLIIGTPFESFFNAPVYIFTTLSLLIAIFAIYLTNYFKISVYTPKIKFKQLLPEKAYSILFILSILIGIINILTQNQILLLKVLPLLLLIIYMAKPLDENVFKLKDRTDLNLLGEINISLFIILVISIIILIIPMDIMMNDADILSNLADSAFVTFTFIIPILIYLHYLEKNMIEPTNQLSKSLSREINTTEDLQKLKNELNSIKVQNEIRSLSDSLLNMENDLIDYGKQLVEISSQKERFETELKLGQDIQKSMIATDFEEFASGKNCEIWGLMKPAREVAGDFYDYFEIDEDNIGFVIGDVAGKGITAALIMVEAMTLIKDYANHYDDISEVFYEVNNLLCEGNVENLFVTCWLGKLNMASGELLFVNAGHNPPLLKHNDEFEYLKTDPDLVLAAMEDMPYTLHKIQLNKGDAIFLYTDGVTEANNNYSGFYGENRLQDMLNKHKNETLKDIIDSIEKDIGDFCDNQEQFDDTTMLIIRLK